MSNDLEYFLSHDSTRLVGDTIQSRVKLDNVPWCAMFSYYYKVKDVLKAYPELIDKDFIALFIQVTRKNENTKSSKT